MTGILRRRKFGHRETQTQREECHVKADAEFGDVLLPAENAKDSWQLLKARRMARKGSPSGLRKEHGPPDFLISDF